jgi:hypothetical protein
MIIIIMPEHGIPQSIYGEFPASEDAIKPINTPQQL